MEYILNNLLFIYFIFKEKYEKLFMGKEIVESNLHKNLAEHLNAEIVLGTITDIAVALHWLRSTFFYIRALKNPRFYGIPLSLSTPQLEARLQGKKKKCRERRSSVVSEFTF